MLIEERQNAILELLHKNPDITVKEISKLLFVSEPTVRRDFTELHKRKLITKVYGGAILNQGTADREIPFLLRENEGSTAKSQIGRLAARLVMDGMVVMLDGSTSAYRLVPYLADKKDIIVVTSGAKTAVALAEANIRTFSTGGKMIINSFSYVGESAEKFVEKINADILFFSCHGLDTDGAMTDRSIEEANLRRVMFSRCKKKVLLCSSSKIGKCYFYNMGNVSEIDEIISEKPLPTEIEEIMASKK
ncbi:MAG: DeoR/GlpR transcriptional regulator [Clostridia bacterium]|nr:DeoR/GlpR transcriptional regulator [Clostridia bacterium]